MKNKKIYFIEVLRFLSSLMVVIWHYQHFFLPHSRQSQYSLDVINSQFFNIFKFDNLGFIAVYLFFCISGFVFSYTYLNKDPITFKFFFYRRFARLYPLHFATLLIVAIIQLINLRLFGEYEIYFISDIKHFILNFFLISSWGFADGFSFNGPIWSVSIEIFLYLIFFFLIPHLKKHRILFSFPLLLLILFIYKIKLITNTSIVEGLLLFFSGVLIFHLFTSAINKYYLAVLSTLLIIISLTGNFKVFMFCPGILMFFVFLDYTFKINTQTKKTFEILGNMTYASYLIHVPIQLIIILIINIFGIQIINFYSTQNFFIFIFVVYVISYFTFKLFEKPLNNFIKNKLIK